MSLPSILGFGPPGIDIANAELDQDYDAATDSFLLGRIDFTVTGPVGSQTNIDFFGETLVVNAGADELDVRLGSATIEVVAIPEPSLTGLLSCVLISTLVRRRRSQE